MALYGLNLAWDGSIQVNQMKKKRFSIYIYIDVHKGAEVNTGVEHKGLFF